MKSFLKVTAVAGVAVMLLSGCLSDSDDTSNGSSSSGTDKLTLSKTGEGFLITWTKNSSGYGEVVYNDGQHNVRGNGTPITSNSKGTILSVCKKTGDGVYSCKASNLSDNSYNYKTVRFSEGTQYQWYTSSGTDHVKGTVEAVTEYNSGILTIN